MYKINSKGSKGLNFERNYTQLKFKPETVEKMSQLSILRQESNLRFCDAGAMLLPLSYRGSWTMMKFSMFQVESV